MHQCDISTLYATRSILSSKWNSNKPTQLVDQREPSQNPMPLSSMDWYGRIRTWTEPPRTSGSSSRTFGRTMALKNALTSSKQLQILHFLFLLHFLSLAQVLE